MITRTVTARWPANAAMVAWVVLFTLSVLTSRVPYVAPLSFIVVALVAWDHGFRAASAWIALVHVFIPCLLFLLKIGPFFVFAEARGTVVTIMAWSLVAATGLAYLTAKVQSLTQELHDSKSALVRANSELQATLDEVKELRGLLPICAWCKDIRDVGGDWEKLESYLTRNSRATFTHAMCPKCLAKQTQTPK